MTMLQADRRRNPYPYTWEIPIGILTGWLLLAGLGVHLGRALANLTAGAGWTWPAGRALLHQPARHPRRQPDRRAGPHRRRAASPAALHGWLIATELVILAGYTVGPGVGRPPLGTRPHERHGQPRPRPNRSSA